MFSRSLLTGIAALSLCSFAFAAPPTFTEGPAPASIKKMATQGAHSGRFITLNYGVSGGKVLLHAFYTGEGEAATGYIDVISPKGKKIQRFELEFPGPAQDKDKYPIKALWLVPGKQKQPMILFDGPDDHLVLVFSRGFGMRGSMQLFSEKGVDGQRKTTFEEIDKRGFRTIRVDVNDAGEDNKPAFKETIFYTWNGERFIERRKK
ncbi:MAG: hypothetical protein QM758_20465 [Armatimonas sp.]